MEEGAAGEDFELFLPGAATYVAPIGRGGLAERETND